ncbi:MAG: Nif3-like dinuclear metal center hexameric protein [Campylobacteraceae bacterium]|nr:Nif3-like dinuclear metal center hexameric protein [Campylobacteraceae bacterium]
MQVREIYDILDELSPFSLQSEWDNSGLLIGDFDLSVDYIYLSLDIDSELVDRLEENSLIITHHPLIFKGLKNINYSKYPANIIQKMIEKNISLISMHTNFDQTHLNKFVAQDILGYEVKSCDEFICYFRVDSSLDSLCLNIKSKLGMKNLRISSSHKDIKDCAITTGSGGDLIDEIQADCFLSGDFKYHQALEAKENGLTLIDIGHFESERFFGDCLAQYLKNLPLKVIMSNSKNPFEYK